MQQPDYPGATGPDDPLDADSEAFLEAMAPRPRRPQGVRIPLKLPGRNTQPLATYILLGLIVAIYLAGQIIPLQPTMTNGYLARSAEEWLFINGAKINDFILQDGEYYRLLTAMFLHGGLAHLFFNGYALYVLGIGIERLYGHGRFLTIYFLSGLTGSVASLMLSPYASVGASGALFGLFGAEAVFFYHHRALFGDFARQRLRNMVFLLGLNLAIGLAPGSQIDNWGHVGGFIGGLVLAWFIAPIFQALPRPMDQPYIELEDTNPLRERLAVPVAYGFGLVGLIWVATLTGV